MSAFSIDSSALVKRYLTEIGSAWLSALLDPVAGHTILVASITRVETAAAIASRQRASDITIPERDRLVRLVLHHVDTEYRIIDLDPPLISRAVELTQRHRLRGYDAVQLAAALRAHAIVTAAGFPGLTLISADEDLNSAAQLEGLASDNPNAHP